MKKIEKQNFLDISENQQVLMGKALLIAKKAFSLGEVPVGAIIVDSKGQILAKAYNRIETLGCQLGHAEVQAIQKACKKVGNWRLEGCFLFVTLQPCLMCFGLASLSRIEGIFYGAKSPLFGFEVEKSALPSGYKELKIVSSLKERECAGILSRFFELARKSGLPN